ncbi:sugar ABC transporter permease, partial [Bacillus sp. S34]|nr:sugar ABC transporter permease [Bacillus sp. S34]
MLLDALVAPTGLLSPQPYALVTPDVGEGPFTAAAVRGEGRLVSFVRTAFFMPVVIGFTAAAYMANVLLVPGTGVINVLLKSVGLTNGDTAWFTSPDTAFWAVIVLT